MLRAASGRALLGLLALSLALMIPLDSFDQLPSFCLFKLVFHRECLGCGMTRAVLHCLHGDFSGAWQFNNGIAIFFPILLSALLVFILKPSLIILPFKRK